jgi:hypothetical protein
MSVIPAADIPLVDAQISHGSVASSSSPTAPQTPSRSSLGTETDAGSAAQNNYLFDLSRALNNLFQRYADRAVVADIPGLQDNEGEVYHESVATIIVRKVEKRVDEEKRRVEFRENRKKRRTAAVQMEIDQQLGGRRNSSTGFRVSENGDIDVRDTFVDRLGFPEEGFLDFTLSVRRALWITSVCMSKMLLVTAIYAAALWGTTIFAASLFEGVTVDDAAVAQFGIPFSNLTHTQTELFDDGLVEDFYQLCNKGYQNFECDVVNSSISCEYSDDEKK